MEPQGVKNTIHLVFSTYEEGYLLGGVNSSRESCILHGVNIKDSSLLSIISITSFSKGYLPFESFSEASCSSVLAHNVGSCICYKLVHVLENHSY